MKTGETQVEKIIDIPLARIRESQASQRAKDVDSLARSIAAVGLMMPIIVRPLPGIDSEFYYELVDGHRRLAAVRKNKSLSIRAIAIDPATADDKVGVLQLTANVQRLQLTPFEEADAIRKLRTAGRTTEEIAADLGMRPQLIARREKLNDLIPGWLQRVEKPLRGETLSIAAAELIAVYPESTQKYLLAQYPNWIPDVQRLRNRLAEFSHRLAAAPWRLDDSLLVPEAGSCTACPKRSSCQPLLFEGEVDSKGKVKDDNCLDTSCWEKKRNALFLRKLGKHRAEHKDLSFIRTGNYQATNVATMKESQKVLSDYQYQRAKKTDKGAKPAVIVNGSQAGDLIWIKTHSPSTASMVAQGGKRAQPLNAEQDRKARRAKFIINKIKAQIFEEEFTPTGLSSQSAENQLKLLAAIIENCCHRSPASRWLKVSEFKKITAKRALEIVSEDILVRCHLPVNSFVDALAWINAVRPFAETVLSLKWSDLEAEALKAIPDPKPKAGATGKKAGKK